MEDREPPPLPPTLEEAVLDWNRYLPTEKSTEVACPVEETASEDIASFTIIEEREDKDYFQGAFMNYGNRGSSTTGRTEMCVVSQEHIERFARITVAISTMQCLQDLFLHASSDGTPIPAMCCRQDITVTLVEPLVSSDELSLYLSNSEEFATADRLYCPASTCATFIGPFPENSLL